MSVTIDGANDYWSLRIGGDDWNAETESRRQAALVSAQDSLAPYLSGLDDADTDAAVYEQALWLLGSRAELQAAGVQSFSLTGLSESYNVSGRPGSVAPAAWRIICYGADGTGGRKRGPVWL